MRQPIVLASSVLAALAFASSAQAANWYVSPTGTATSGCVTREAPCSLASASAGAVAGDVVNLMDGIYKEMLYVTNSGTETAWITFQADECATPIIEGTGVGPAEDNQDNGVHSTTATYVRFIGIVSRGWNTGFGNGWTGADTTSSNGHWEFKYCIGDGNGRTGFTFFSAADIKIQYCISSHNGSSTSHSWSSGVTLLQAQGTTNLVQGNVAFENMDAQNNSDGSGFIVDEYSNGATFVNNVAFGNGGSCYRMTRSSGSKFINNTCYHNARNPMARGPTDPSEVYFTDGESQTGVSFVNNVFLATGVGAGQMPIAGKPNGGWTNNVEGTGAATYFKAPDGTNPDYTLSTSSTQLIGKGMASAGVPTNDIGFDPKCIVKRDPTLIGSIAKGGWWQYDIDIAYIQSLGGVAKCFNPSARSSPLDIGAYKAGAVTTVTPGTCVQTPVIAPPMGGMGGMGGVAGAASAVGGAGGLATSGGTTSAGGAPPGAGAPSVGGTVSAGGPSTSGGAGTAGGIPATGGTGQPGAGGATASGGTSTTSSAAGKDAEEPAGCGCRVTGSERSQSVAWLGLLGLAMAVGARRRR